MKRHLSGLPIAVVFMLLFTFAAKQPAPKLFFTPEHPRAGEEITIKYNSEGTGLSGRDRVEMITYLYSADLDETVGVEMKKEGGLWTASIKPDPSTRGMIIKFKSGEYTDNNKGKGFIVKLYGNDGKELPGTLAGLAAACALWGPNIAGLERDREGADKLFQEEFRRNPNLKSEYLDEYFRVISPLMGEKADGIIAKELKNLEKKPAASEEYYTLMATWYAKLKNEDKASRYKKLLLEKYPSGKFAQNEEFSAITKTSEPGKRLEQLKSFEAAYPKSELIAELYDDMATLYIENRMYKEAVDLLKENPERPAPYSFYNASFQMLKAGADAGLAAEVSALGVEKSRQELSNAAEKKTNTLSPGEWQEQLQYSLGMNLYSLGSARNKMDKKDEALSAISEALPLLKNSEPEANELYANILIQKGENDKALKHLETVIKSGNSTPLMKEYLKTAYAGKNGSHAGFSEYLSALEASSRETLVQKLKKEMLDDRAPDFKLRDLEGKEVSLSSLKGKTIILDFWATWCPPCRASFPGMKKAVEKYSSRPDVRFLFIDTRERVEDKKKNAADFLSKNQYPFHVLLDNESKVNELYKVPGIPTKVVIGKDGLIKFKVIGFDGNTDKMLDEIDAMISMAD
ncbi:MAG: redoxin domain-containing protein [Ignavibacteria bacterium]|jgi:peroxiredoxin|nr:redoxin domain-containing protein [Ignavibacteria bacterium]MCU7503403.1 redoxin domain-containing protein [Ignavibacteria bacterium]MCU7516265.1 redoxin domain-containing protein [Ignavibacteria bacterium]